MIIESEVNELARLLDGVRDQLLEDPAVFAVGVGVREDTTSGELAVKIYLDRAARESVDHVRLQNLARELPIEFIEAKRPAVGRSEVRELSSYNDGSGTLPSVSGWSASIGPRVFDQRYDPLLGGSRIQTVPGWLGTLGGTVFRTDTTDAYGLTNWHVADSGDGSPVGNSIYQPFVSANNLIGTCVSALLGKVGAGWVDAALIQLNQSRKTSQSMVGIGEPATTAATAPKLQMLAVKSGRTTEVTYARVEAVAVSTKINYGPPAGTVTLANQIMLRRDPNNPPTGGEVSDGGDSGSLWLERGTHRAFALNFAGEMEGDADDRAIANPIFAVLNATGTRFEPYPYAIYRWWSQSDTDHFYCKDAGGEIAPIVGYTYEGAPWGLLSPQEPGATRFYRWYSGTFRDHFYTTSQSGELAPQYGYVYEGVLGWIGKSPQPGLVPLYRWFHPGYHDHFYTTSKTGELAPGGGYAAEGIAGYVKPL